MKAHKERNPKAKSAPRPRPRLLSGGNPQIAKADGDAPVQAWIAALSGWRHARAVRVDELVTRALPGVHKCVRWNSPLYGAESGTWFLGLHVFAKYLKLAFVQGASLQPQPPGASKQAHVRYLDLREHEELDDSQFMAWVQQASRLPAEQLRASTKPARSNASAQPSPAPAQIDARIAELPDWRGTTLARARALICRTLPDVVEEWKWGVPVWSRDGILCTGESYKNAVKLTFPHGAALPDPKRLFNSSLGGSTRRALDLHEDSALDERAFATLLRAAARFNRSALATKTRKR